MARKRKSPTIGASGPKERSPEELQNTTGAAGAQAKIRLTLFFSESAQEKEEVELTLHELAAFVRGTPAASKAGLPWFKFGTFGDKRTKLNCLRHNKNVLTITGVEGDYDRGKISVDEAVAITKRAGLAALIYTSASHTEAFPRWRIAVPASKELPPEERYRLMARVNGLFGGVLSGESFTLSQSYYLGCVGENPDHRAEVIEGDCIDLRDDLDAGAMGKWAEAPDDVHTDGSNVCWDLVETLYANATRPPFAKVAAALQATPNDIKIKRAEWVSVGHAVKSAYPGDDGLEVYRSWTKSWTEWGTLNDKGEVREYNEAYVVEKWKSFAPTTITATSLFRRADKASPGWWASKQETLKEEEWRLEDIAPHDFPEEGTLERYDWQLGRHLLRGEVTGTVAPGGTGKSSHGILEALAMASGKQLTHDTVSSEPLRVLLINLEDKRNTMNKRIAAAMSHHKLKKEDIGGRLFVLAKGEIKIKIAKQEHTGNVKRNEKTIARLTEFARGRGIDVVSIDSFIRTHSVGENDNSAVQEVVECFEDIAAAANCGVHLWHHTRKDKGDGEGSTVESARGAKAFIDACRSVRVFETMSKGQGEKLKIEKPRQYFRAYSGKRNFAPHIEESHWYHIESVRLLNGPLNYTADGDDIGVIETWSLPAIEELTPENIAAIRTAVDGNRWREYISAEMWVGKCIAKVLSLDAKEHREPLKQLVMKLVKDGVLTTVVGKTHDRKDCIYVVTVPKGAPILTVVPKDGPVECVVCHKRIKSSRKDAQFCSDKCKQKAYRERP